MTARKAKGDFVLCDDPINSLKNKGYIIKQKIGAGSYATIYSAHSDHQKGDVALKIMEIARLSDDFKNKFMNKEIEAMKAVGKHANVVEFYASFKDEKYIFIAMEYCTNGDVYDYIRHHRMLSEQQACFWFRQLIEGVSHCHKQGIAHRDLKCENLLLDSNFNLKITDFGFACRVKPKRSGSKESSEDLVEAISNTFCGSILYASPELLQSKPYDPTKSDTWSCGAVLFICLFGFYPLDEAKIKEAYETLDYSIQIPDSPEVSQECKELINSIFVDENKRITTDDIIKCNWFKKKWTNAVTFNKEYFESVNIPRQETLEFDVGVVTKLSHSSSSFSSRSTITELRISGKKKTGNQKTISDQQNTNRKSSK